MTVREIIAEHLKKIGATGLCYESCGCQLPDLVPCDGDCMECVPAVRQKCPPVCEECGGDGCMKPLVRCEMADKCEASKTHPCGCDSPHSETPTCADECGRSNGHRHATCRPVVAANGQIEALRE